jgi:putative endonuclease
MGPTLWGVYIVRCADGTLYCGATNDVEARVKKHNSGKGARYTSKRLPVELMAWTGNVFPKAGRGGALSFEWHVKRMYRTKKIPAVLRMAAKMKGVVCPPSV